MSMFPKVQRLGTGKYRVHCGEEHVDVIALYRKKQWYARHKGSPTRVIFQTKKEAVEWATDWLNEYA